MNILKLGSRGAEVKALQETLGIAQDGVFGKATEQAVKDFQSMNGLVADGVVGVKTWLKLKTDGSIFKKSSRNIKNIIIHCTATPENRPCTVEEVRGWHKARGFNDIGYHYLVYLDGSIHLGRDVQIAGAHCTNQNMTSIGVCYVGGCASDGKTPKDTRTEAQKAALLSLLKELRKLYPKAAIRGHNEFANKACPCFNVAQEYKGI